MCVKWLILSFHIPCKGGDLNVSHRSFNIGNYVCDNRTEGEILIWRSCLINQDKFSLFLFVFLLSSMLKGWQRVYTRRMIKAKINMWHVNFTERLDSWIYEPAWGVICLLKYTWPMIVFSKLVKTSWFPWKTFIQEERFEVPLSFTWGVNFSNDRTWNEISIRPSPPTSHFPSLLTWLIKASTFGNRPQG